MPFLCTQLLVVLQEIIARGDASQHYPKLLIFLLQSACSRDMPSRANHGTSLSRNPPSMTARDRCLNPLSPWDGKDYIAFVGATYPDAREPRESESGLRAPMPPSRPRAKMADAEWSRVARGP